MKQLISLVLPKSVPYHVPLSALALQTLVLPPGTIPDANPNQDIVFPPTLPSHLTAQKNGNSIGCICPGVSNLTLKDVSNLNLPNVEAQFPSLREITLHLTEITPVVSTDMLRRLVIHKAPDNLTLNCPNLLHLKLHAVKTITDKWVETVIPTLKSLKVLFMRNTSLCQPVFKSMSLITLTLKYNDSLENVKVIANSIESVSIIGNPKCSYEILPPESQSCNLEALDPALVQNVTLTQPDINFNNKPSNDPQYSTHLNFAPPQVQQHATV